MKNLNMWGWVVSGWLAVLAAVYTRLHYEPSIYLGLLWTSAFLFGYFSIAKLKEISK
jgi:hypothetical protein